MKKKIFSILLTIFLFLVFIQPFFASKAYMPGYSSLIPKNSTLGLKINLYFLPRNKTLQKVLDLKIFNRFRKFKEFYKLKSGLNSQDFRPEFWFFSTLPPRDEESIIVVHNAYKHKPSEYYTVKNNEYNKYHFKIIGDGAFVFSKSKSIVESAKPIDNNTSRFIENHFAKKDISFALLIPDRIRNKFSSNEYLNSLALVRELQGGLEVEKDEIFLEASFSPIEKISIKELNEAIKKTNRMIKSVIGNNKVVTILDRLNIKSSENVITISGKYKFEEFKHLDELLEISIFWKFVNTLLQ